MKRWPWVRSPARMPSTSTGTTEAPASSCTMARIECSGRTQRRDPAPQRIDLGQGKLRIAASSASAITSEASRPGFSITAKRTSPFLSARTSSWSRVRPVDLRNPSTAFSGASARGPLRSSFVAFVAFGKSCTASVRRRGVAKAAAAA